jgi:PAS domain S-box-containing protein
MNPAAPKILVVEDDADARENLCDILALDGYEIETASTGRDVIVRADWRDVGIVLLDRRLPDKSAEELLPILRERAPESAVIIVTGYGDMDSAITALRLGAVDYLLKPINPDALRLGLSRILQQRRTEEELRERREFAESLVETAHAIVLVLDTQGRIVQYNSYLEQLCGRRLSDVSGHDWFESFLPPRDRQRIRELFNAAIHGQPVEGNVNPIVASDQREIEIEWWAKTLINSNAELTGLLCIGHDVTHLKAAQARALQTERLAAIGQMVAGLAHESRNALQRTQACLEMLETEVEDRPEALEYVHRIQNAQHHVQHLFNEVRGYAAPIRLETEECNLATVWRQAWAQLDAERRPGGAKLVEQSAGVDLSCNVDPFRMEQVFRNIFENALAVMPDHLRLEIRAKATTLAGQLAIQVSFHDNGPGMTAEQRQRIFEPFFTTKTSGTGLGMAIASRIMEAHGGEIAVGECNRGAEIVVTLPRPTR